MDRAHRNLAVAVGAAKDQAKQILSQLERQGHAHSGRSSTLYLALVMIHQQVQAADPSSVPLKHFLPDLEQLTRRCEGTLAPVKPLLEAAVRLAREEGEGGA
ncbi:MAG TPA: hypothetical protein VM736_10660 [Gemmatimonadales bacterium]|nr:hypothetical protein [Gemmatimonadales bacterium]